MAEREVVSAEALGTLYGNYRVGLTTTAPQALLAHGVPESVVMVNRGSAAGLCASLDAALDASLPDRVRLFDTGRRLRPDNDSRVLLTIVSKLGIGPAGSRLRKLSTATRQ